MFSFFTLYHLCAMCLTPSRLTLFPSTTLFRSKARLAAHPQVEEIPQAGAVVVAHFLLGIVAGATLGEDQPPPLGRTLQHALPDRCRHGGSPQSTAQQAGQGGNPDDSGHGLSSPRLHVQRACRAACRAAWRPRKTQSRTEMPLAI